MHIISLDEYNSESHKACKKYAQVSEAKSSFGKALQIVCCVFYSDEFPDFGEFRRPVAHYELPDNSPVKVGWVRTDSGDFVNQSTAYRQLHTDEELLAHIRRVRGLELLKCDPLIMRHMSQPENAKTLTEAQYAELQGYMQALRDFPANVDLDNIIWPPKPAFMN